MSPTPVTDKENVKSNLADSFSLAAKNFLLLPGIARDLNEAVQSIIGIVKQKGGEAKEGVDEKFIAEQDYKTKEKLKAPTVVTEEKSTKKKGILGFVIVALGKGVFENEVTEMPNNKINTNKYLNEFLNLCKVLPLRFLIKKSLLKTTL